MLLLALPLEVLVEALRRLTPADARPRARREGVGALLHLVSSCRALWRAAADPHGDLGRHLAALCQDTAFSRLSVVRRLGLQATNACFLCRVVCPAPVRKGFGRRLCAWCFENCTVSRPAIARVWPWLAAALVETPSDTRQIRDYALGRAVKTTARVHLLEDVLAAASRVSAPRR
jgi:hypothetical protein